MALPALLRRFEIELADIDRHVYETLSWRVAQHPSEDGARVVVRTLAHCLLLAEGLEEGAGLSTVEEPALWTRDPGGRVRLWVDVGAPSAERLHRASKAADRVIVVTHKSAEQLNRAWAGKRVHDAESISVYLLDPTAVNALVDTLDRKNDWVVTCHEGQLNITSGTVNAVADWTPQPLTSF